jgi:hypothetical protein
LSSKEEINIVSYMLEMQSIGFGLSASDVREYAFHSASGKEKISAMMHLRFCGVYLR